ncbi:MAG: FkbM family methyltransferase [Rhizomicrobium sp.]
MASRQGLFAVGAEDEFVGRSLRETGAYGLAEIALAARKISRNDDVLVVGAHVGTLAIPLARLCNHVTAIEANPWTFKLLQCNIILNDVKNISAYNFAANDKQEKLRFVMNTINSGGSKRLPKTRRPEYFHDNPKLIDVDAFPLDDKFINYIPSLIIMDIEGSEYFALKGMTKMLEKSKTLFIEYLPHHLSMVSGIEPELLATILRSHFDRAFFPSTGESYQNENFTRVLREKFDRQEGHECVIFTKNSSPA